MNWLSQFFIHSSFVLPGAALIAAPILIHLINRMRYRRVRFAAMEFLLQSHQRNRRKLLLEQLLLLLLRCAAVLALVALIARPFFDPSQLLILQGEKTHHVVLLDDSGSMRNRWGETSAFQAGLEVVQKLAAQGAAQAGTQELTLMLLSQIDQPLFSQRSLDPSFLSELDDKLQNLKATYRSLDLAAGLEAAGRELNKPAVARNLHVISDFRARDWEQNSALAAILKDLDSDGIAVNLIKTVPERSPNLAVTELSGSVHVAAANVPIRLRVGVRNDGEQVAQNVRLAVLQDGVKLPLTIAISNLEPGKEVFREFDVVFSETGKHEVRVVLPADSLEADNVRYLALDISEANPVLIISGDLTDSETLYLQDALAPEKGITGFAPVIESIEFLRRQPLHPYQCIYMVNVPEIPADALRILENYVQSGGGLAWFLGPQVRPSFYNDKLYRDGNGLFPAELATVAELVPDETNPAPDLEFADHPMFRAFQGQDNPFVADVHVERYFSTPRDWKAPESVEVIARLRNRAPIFLEHRFGQGRVVTCLTTVGTNWTDWPRNPSYVLLQLELEKHIARNDRTLERRIVGEPIEISLDPAAYRTQIEIQAPDASAVTRLTATPKSAVSSDDPASATDTPDAAQSPPADANDADAVRLVETFRDTSNPGVYTVIRFRQDETSERQLIAYNVPLEESELSLASNEDIRGPFGANMTIQEPGDFAWIQGKQAGQEIRDLILMALLGILLIEQLLAMRLSFHPRTAGARA